MKKYLTHLLALVACFLCSMTANAQFSATIEMYPATGYDRDGHDFSLAEVATALGTDAATLAADLDAWMAEEAPTEFWFQTSEFAPTSLADYTANDRGFWMKLDGTVVPYGGTEEEPNSQAMYSLFTWDAEAGTFTVSLGQMPDKLVGGDEGHVILVLAKGENKVTFDMTLKIIQKETPDLPTPVTDLAALNIVGTKNIEWAQYPNMPMDQIVDLTGVAEALGTTDEIIAENLSSFLFMTTLELKGEDEASQKPYKTATLSNESTATPYPGFWMAAVWDDEIEAISEEAVRCVYGEHAAFRVMWSADYSYNATTKELTSVTGWESYTLEFGSKYNFDLYIVYGDKAFKLHHVISLTQKPEEDPNKWAKIGEESQEVSFKKGATTVLNLDLDVIATALDCEVSNLKVYGPSDTQGNIDDRHTANNGGFWFSNEGVVCGYGETGYTFYIEPTSNNNFSSWNVGNYIAPITEGESYTTTLFFFNGNKSDSNNKYYAVHVIVKCEDKQHIEVEFESVLELSYTLAAELPTGYDVEGAVELDMDAIEAAIGTRNFELYTWEKAEDGTTEYTNEYTCTGTSMGFYLTREGFLGRWGNGDPWAAGYTNGTFIFWSYPGKNQNGDVFNTTIFLVNTETGKMVTVHLKLILGDVVKYEEVGSKVITLIADPDTEHEVILVDFADAIEAMGVDDVTTLLSGQCVAVITSEGIWSDPQMPSEGIALNDQGYFDTANTAFTIYMNPSTEGTTVEMSVDNEKGAAINPDFKLPAKLAIQRDVDGNLKQFTLNINIVSLATVGVTDMKSSDENAVIYDLSGRRSDATRKGVYIKNGKKVVK